MSTATRIDDERLFHDRQAHDRASRFDSLSALRFRDADYLDHEPWIRPAMMALGNLEGRRVLDLGCGHGMAGVVMARRGAMVTGIDLSNGYIQEARQRALANEVMAEFMVGDAERLSFPDRSFDAIWGSAILHHLDMDVACAEIRRVLRPGGVAVFCEPWGGNPILEFGRRFVPYPGKHRTPDERPLRSADVEAIRRQFTSVEVHGFHLFGALIRLVRRESSTGSWLDRMDARLLRLVPRLQKLARYVVIELHRA